MSLRGIWVVLILMTGIDVARSRYGDLIQRDLLRDITDFAEVGIVISLNAGVSWLANWLAGLEWRGRR